MCGKYNLNMFFQLLFFAPSPSLFPPNNLFLSLNLKWYFCIIMSTLVKVLNLFQCIWGYQVYNRGMTTIFSVFSVKSTSSYHVKKRRNCELLIFTLFVFKIVIPSMSVTIFIVKRERKKKYVIFF